MREENVEQSFLFLLNRFFSFNMFVLLHLHIFDCDFGDDHSNIEIVTVISCDNNATKCHARDDDDEDDYDDDEEDVYGDDDDDDLLRGLLSHAAPGC